MYLRQAGERAAARSAHREAIAFFEQVLAVLSELPETPETLAVSADVRIAHATALFSIEGSASSDVEARVRHTHALARRLGDVTRLFPALWWLWYVAYGRGRYGEALDLAQQLLTVAEPDGDSGRLLEAHHALWATLSAMGEFVAAIPHCERGIALYDPARHAAQAFIYGGHDPGACCRYHLAGAQWRAGYPERALRIIRVALGLAEKLSHPLTMVHALSHTELLSYQMGDYNAARETAERMLAIASTHEFTHRMDDGRVILACVAARQRGDHQALDELYGWLLARQSWSTAERRVTNLSFSPAPERRRRCRQVWPRWTRSRPSTATSRQKPDGCASLLRRGERRRASDSSVRRSSLRGAARSGS
jgi:tetratricopeptide (TPR) repeat protein